MPPCRKFPHFRWTFGCPGHGGYRVVQPKGKLHYVHHIIARAFIPNPDNLPTIDHFPDRNPANNSVDNLRWADYKMQANNRQICEDSAAKYGVRYCDDKQAYSAAYNAAHKAEIEAYRAARRAERRARKAAHAIAKMKDLALILEEAAKQLRKMATDMSAYAEADMKK